ncbi:MAG: hypothetical protein QOG03_442 [Actinomycetota bacterium]|nr:hypothetical protein [Actinomycetota bacterium]
MKDHHSFSVISQSAVPHHPVSFSDALRSRVDEPLKLVSVRLIGAHRLRLVGVLGRGVPRPFGALANPPDFPPRDYPFTLQPVDQVWVPPRGGVTGAQGAEIVVGVELVGPAKGWSQGFDVAYRRRGRGRLEHERLAFGLVVCPASTAADDCTTDLVTPRR